MDLVYWFLNHIGEIASVITVIGANGAIILMSHRRLHADIMTIKEDAKVTNLRIDATGNRIDNLYNVMLGMLKNESQIKKAE